MSKVKRKKEWSKLRKLDSEDVELLTVSMEGVHVSGGGGSGSAEFASLEDTPSDSGKLESFSSPPDGTDDFLAVVSFNLRRGIEQVNLFYFVCRELIQLHWPWINVKNMS